MTFLVRVDTTGFNPRVREGRDEQFRERRQHSVVSIHASVKDATLAPMRNSSTINCFNPRVREGRD